MTYLQYYLAGGLLLHKAVWEIFKRKSKSAPPRAAAKTSLASQAAKAVKIAILAGILVQTFLPPVLPISSSPAKLELIGALLYTLGLSLALAARFELGRNWSDIEAGLIREGHNIVDTGVYRYIRHPIYVGDLALLVGLELALNSWLVAAAVALIPAVLWKAIQEENVIRRSLPGYEDYCQRTNRFIPLRAKATLAALLVAATAAALFSWTSSIPPQPASASNAYVYVTHAGRWYHLEGCRYLARTNDKMTLQEAKNRGLHPCKICNPR